MFILCVSIYLAIGIMRVIYDFTNPITTSRPAYTRGSAETKIIFTIFVVFLWPLFLLFKWAMELYLSLRK